jgi:hypothetical protein
MKEPQLQASFVSSPKKNGKAPPQSQPLNRKPATADDQIAE